MTVRSLAAWLASRARTRPVTLVVVHATAGGTLSGALSALRGNGLSYHYLVGLDGVVTKAVPTSRVAFHAGRSVGPDASVPEKTGCNGYSIGISLVNRNDGSPITPAQDAALRELVATLAREVPTLRWIATHWAITVKPDGRARKTDPRGVDPARYAGRLAVWKPSYAKRSYLP